MAIQDASWLAILGFIIVAISLLFVQIGFIFARKKNYKNHYKVMGGALFLNTIFLITYVTRFLTNDETSFPGPENIKIFFYYPFLLVHIILALVVIGWIFTFVPQTVKKKKMTSDGAPYFEDKDLREMHRKRGFIAYVMWTISFAMGIVIFIMLYIINWS